jgi:hypothetical protein
MIKLRCDGNKNVGSPGLPSVMIPSYQKRLFPPSNMDMVSSVALALALLLIFGYQARRALDRDISPFLGLRSLVECRAKPHKE